MNAAMNWVRANRPRASGIAVIVIGWLVLTPVPDLVITGLISIVGLLLGTAVHDAVLTTEKAAAAVRVASSQAATEVAARLTKSDNIGGPGELTEIGVIAATDAAMGAADNVLESIGIDDKGHRK